MPLVKIESYHLVELKLCDLKRLEPTEESHTFVENYFRHLAKHFQILNVKKKSGEILFFVAFL